MVGRAFRRLPHTLPHIVLPHAARKTGGSPARARSEVTGDRTVVAVGPDVWSTFVFVWVFVSGSFAEDHRVPTGEVRSVLEHLYIRFEEFFIFRIKRLHAGDSPPAPVVVPAHRSLYLPPLLFRRPDHLADVGLLLGIAEDVVGQRVEDVTDLPSIAPLFEVL